MTDPSFDLFDLSWVGDDKVVTGGVDGVKVWSIRDQSTPRALTMAVHCPARLLTDVTASVRFTEGFVKGIGAHGRRFLATQSNDRRAVVWARHEDLDDVRPTPFPGFSQVIDETELLGTAPMDIPYYRRPRYASCATRDCLMYIASILLERLSRSHTENTDANASGLPSC